MEIARGEGRGATADSADFVVVGAADIEPDTEAERSHAQVDAVLEPACERPESAQIRANPRSASVSWPALPTETDIYILPDGRVVVADLPLELAALTAALGVPEACEVDLLYPNKPDCSGLSG